MNHGNTHNSRGFTIIELMLAMSFVAALLVAIAMTTIQISQIYNKGLTLREVNQVGRSATEDLQRTLAAARPFDVTNTAAAGTSYYNTNDSGILCVGRYSYVWNYGTTLNGDGTRGYKYQDGTLVHFAKVDDNGAQCADRTTMIDQARATELLATGDRNLALHQFSITMNTKDDVSGQELYAISMKIGSNDQGQLTDTGTCRPPSDGNGNQDYCSVNQFDFVVRSGNKSGAQ